MSQPESIIIVGAGIVGSALANHLSSTPRTITVLDRSLTPLVGSTGHAPGFIGQFNESHVLTKLAIDTVSEYSKIPDGFDPVGGLEVAFQTAGVERLKSRQRTARHFGLTAEVVSIDRAHELAPELVARSDSGAALFFPTDGTADAGRITTFYQEKARQAGVSFLQCDVRKLITSGGAITGVDITDGHITKHIKADKVILATGIWAQDLCHNLDIPIPVVPVGHPYMHGQPREPVAQRAPFVRWPEAHVYARDHGDRYGIGSYNHAPLGCRSPDGTAIGDWTRDFERPLEKATSLLPVHIKEQFKQGKSFNGIFSMTPDNMPLAGAVASVPGLYMAVAVWVTHGAATAKFVSRLIDGDGGDDETKRMLDPERFKGQNIGELEEQSLGRYSSIYTTKK